MERVLAVLVAQQRDGLRPRPVRVPRLVEPPDSLCEEGTGISLLIAYSMPHRCSPVSSMNGSTSSMSCSERRASSMSSTSQERMTELWFQL
ncbi:MAG: hypothetical protein WD232_10830 [Acidimicrobiales bacterium]